MGELFYPESELKNFVNNPQARERIDWIRNNVEGSVMEVGCGTGYILRSIYNFDFKALKERPDVAGVDIQWGFLLSCKRDMPLGKFACCDIATGHLPFESNSYDTVLVPEILEHVRPVFAHLIIEEAYRIAKKQVLITTPNGSQEGTYYAGTVESGDHMMIYTKEIFKHFLEPDEKTRKWYAGSNVVARPISFYDYKMKISEPYGSFILIKIDKNPKDYLKEDLNGYI